MKKILLIGIIVLIAYSVIAYTPPGNQDVTLVLDIDYVAPDNQNINLILSDVVPPSVCDCPDVDTNWIITEHCQITTDCNIGTGILNITTGGWINVSNSAIINASKIIWLPKDATEIFRLRWSDGAKIRWGQK